MRRTVLHILSTSYSGSSLLALLLNSQPGVRGLGEAVHLADRSRSAHCLRCRVSAAECKLGRSLSPDRFYGSLFDSYGPAIQVLVDTSKSLWNSLLKHRPEPGLRHQCVLLSKAPHEFAASWVGHHPETTVPEAFRVYLDYYRTQLAFLGRACRISPDYTTSITYRELARRPELVIRTLCCFAHITSKPLSECRWWETDSHIIGGNWLVNAQVAGFHRTLQRASQRDQRRYRGREHAVFYDESWKAEPEFLWTCSTAYQQFGPVLEPVLRELRQPSAERLRQEVLEAEALVR